MFAVHVAPSPEGAQRQEAVLYLPPFAEEMNRSRRMASLFARSLASKGFGVLILDLFGTGDSAGDFVDARWPLWREDARAACSWLTERSYQKISLVGLRLGAWLALETAAAEELREVLAKVVLWQPTASGETFLNQFLRIRVVAGLDQNEQGAKETVKELRNRLHKGGAVEIAGYELSGALAADIAGLDLHSLLQACHLPITWIEIGASPGLSPASGKVIGALANSAISLSTCALVGEPFWSIEEPVLNPELWDETAAALSDT